MLGVQLQSKPRDAQQEHAMCNGSVAGSESQSHRPTSTCATLMNRP